MKPFKGVVTSAKMQKTAVVEIKQTKIHPLYQKRMVKVKRYHVHDELGAKVGDMVEFVGTKPISKTKKWQISKILPKERVKTA